LGATVGVGGTVGVGVLVAVAGIAVLVAVCGGWLGVAVTTIVPRPGSVQASADKPSTPAVNSTIGRRLWFRIMVADYAEQVSQSQTGARV